MPNTAKAEAIRKAYGEYWERFHTEIQEEVIQLDGWLDWLSLNDLDIGELFFKIFNDIDIDFDYDKERLRPKSLKGIETNNGWQRIDSEEDLPRHKVWLTDGNRIWDGHLFTAFSDERMNTMATDWQPIVKPEKPIY